ncbi:protease HtpX [Candidatus Gracilibacteria bacterium]|nr:protease HtpX [Candidatus Gracilibacteria bacterium]NUJ99234.1 protease HtpX [Candidatus Gracilibacteria bacterium]
MSFLRRVFFFLLTNLAVILLINIVFALLQAFFGINISAYGYDYLSIFIFAGIVGSLGAFVSLFLSKWSAKRIYNIELLTKQNYSSFSPKEVLFYNTVLEISEKNHIKMPELGVYISPDPNAFATGATKNSSLVAVSSGLLDSMEKNEIEAVVAHEMAHILNGDMVTMTLLQGILNTFVIFISRVIANIADAYFGKEEKGPSFIYYIVSFVLELFLGILASFVVMWFSRKREFRADEGSAKFVGKEKMIQALEALKRVSSVQIDTETKFASFKINAKKKGGIKSLLASHPSLEKRIENLKNL